MVCIGPSDLLSAKVCVCVRARACVSLRKAEKIRTKEEEDEKGQEGNRMKETMREERETRVAGMRERADEEGGRKGGKDSGG